MASRATEQVITNSVISLLTKAIEARASLFDARHETAFRLFNGFAEGEPDLVVDLFASTLVFHNYGADPEKAILLVEQAKQFLQDKLPWVRAGVSKTRNGTPALVRLTCPGGRCQGKPHGARETLEEKRGQLLFGLTPDTKIKEHGVWYSINLTLNRDTSFYLDTRNLRKWLIEHMRDKTVLNSFAYTGSLGVAAQAGGAKRVVQHDINRRFLNVARTSYPLNGFAIHKEDFIAEDFFTLVGNLKGAKETFDCVIIDPPFFSTTSKGKVDQINDSARLINKVRPLINDGGTLIAINNALYVSGQEYMQTLERLCKDGYLKIQELISIPEDFAGYPETRVGLPMTDPAPFNHSTKIAVLSVKRKSAM
jgi:23S rRNA (cytosine1962-C5)-methyltransferase